MWKIHRYYLREIGVNAVLSFLVLFGIALICLLYKGIRMVKGGDLVDAAITTLLLAADAIPHLLTVAFLFATVLAFARASQDREITAIRSAGISPRVPLVSALLIGVICSLIAAVSNHYLLPWAHYSKYRVVAELYKKAIERLTEQEGRIALGGGTMTWKHRDRGNVFQDVLIFCKDKNLARAIGIRKLGQAGTLVRATRASIHTHEDTDQLSLRLEEVRVPAAGTFGGNLQIKIDLRRIAEKERRSERDKDLRSDSLLSEVARGVRSEHGAQYARYMVYRRTCFALMPFLLAPIGFCIGVLSRERGRVLALSLCIVPLGIFYVTDFMGENLLSHTTSSSRDLIGWLPAAVTLVIGTPFCWRLLRI
ncbi:MAG: LptF/LptG family permease [Planctomycetota bacterium]|jgi:lipopolysaccharide export system permease protein